MQSIARLKFDLQIGAVIDSTYPTQSLSTQEQRELCNLAFPESSAGQAKGKESEGDMYFTFRMRQRDPN